MQAEVRRITSSRKWGQFQYHGYFLSLRSSVSILYSFTRLALSIDDVLSTRKIKISNVRNSSCPHGAFYAAGERDASNNSADTCGLKCDMQLRAGRVCDCNREDLIPWGGANWPQVWRIRAVISPECKFKSCHDFPQMMKYWLVPLFQSFCPVRFIN